MTLAIYSHAVDANKLAAQEMFLDALGLTDSVQWRNEKRNGKHTEGRGEGVHLAEKGMVGTRRLELLTSTVSR